MIGVSDGSIVLDLRLEMETTELHGISRIYVVTLIWSFKSHIPRHNAQAYSSMREHMREFTIITLVTLNSNQQHQKHLVGSARS
jgi:hypothetical protein